MGILTDDKGGEDFDRRLGRRKTIIGREGNKDLVGHSAHIEDDVGGERFHQGALQVSDHCALVDAGRDAGKSGLKRIKKPVCAKKGLDLAFHICYCVYVKNITVSLDNDVYRRARIKAAEADTSVSALVKQFLNDMAREETEFERRKRLQSETLATIRSFRAGDRLKREDVYDRHALS